MDKRCTKCDKVKDENDFAWKSKSKGKRHSECKECHRAVRKDYYRRNKKKVFDKVVARRKEIVLWLQEYKADLYCMNCDEDHVAVIEFHHKDSDDKIADVSRMAHLGYSKDRIMKEIAKCDVLCKNCHAIEHYNLRAGIV